MPRPRGRSAPAPLDVLIRCESAEMLAFLPWSERGRAWLLKHASGIGRTGRFMTGSTIRSEWLEWKMRRDKIKYDVDCLPGASRGMATKKRSSGAKQIGLIQWSVHTPMNKMAHSGHGIYLISSDKRFIVYASKKLGNVTFSAVDYAVASVLPAEHGFPRREAKYSRIPLRTPFDYDIADLDKVKVAVERWAAEHPVETYEVEGVVDGASRGTVAPPLRVVSYSFRRRYE